MIFLLLLYYYWIICVLWLQCDIHASIYEGNTTGPHLVPAYTTQADLEKGVDALAKERRHQQVRLKKYGKPEETHLT